MDRIALLMTRPEGANAAFARQFPQALAEAVEPIDCPLMRIVPLDQEVGMPAEVAAIFTSSNGVRFAPPGLGRRAFCVGARTTESATAAGWRAICAGQTAEGLIDHLLQLRPVAPLWHLCGRHVRGEVAERLQEEGFEVTRVALYDQHLMPLSHKADRCLAEKKPVLVPLFSPRAASHFAAVAPPHPHMWLVALSAAVADALPQDLGFQAVTAAEPTAAAVIASIEKLVETIRLG